MSCSRGSRRRDDASAAAGADLVIEAVFEDPAVKAQVFEEIEPHLLPDALLGSNTSTLPITELAEGVSRPADFIGLHFFSPVDKMPLLEIIKGEKTSDETLYRALDVAKQIKKTPIVVNDSRGFFTSRVIGTFINEGVGMLLEGVPAASIEQASSQAGYPAPVLQLSDELNLNLARKIRDATKAAVEAEGGVFEDRASFQVVDRLLDAGRGGKLAGAGYYDYEDGKRVGLWKGLKEMFPEIEDPASISLEGPRGADAVHRVDRGRQVPRRGRDRDGRGREHRLDPRHRLPRLDGRGAPVHRRLRGSRGQRSRRLRRAGARARETATASASSRRPRSSRRPSAARRTAAPKPCSPGPERLSPAVGAGAPWRPPVSS